MNVAGRAFKVGLACTLAAGPVAAVELRLPQTARQTVERNTPLDRYRAPVDVYENGALRSVDIDGAVARSVWRIDQQGLTPLQIAAPLRAQIEEAGYEIVLDCAATACGGYDFRFATEVLPGPNMYVNLRDFHFITGLRDDADAPEAAVTVFASSGSAVSYVQIIQAGEAAAEDAPDVVALPPEAQVAVPPASFEEALERDGRIVLTSLDFASGTSTLGEGPFAALDALAQVMQDQPNLRVALVGHTDTVGALDMNIGLSRARAQSVRARLIERYGVAAGRLDAEGMGYLAPLTSNTTEAGREENRRVEAIVVAF